MTKRILIVEDEEDILELLSVIFADVGDYEVLCARDSKEAIRMAQDHSPDIILLDILLPKMNGYDVCQSVKSDPIMSRVKVSARSGVVQKSSQQKAQEVGADAFIAKPFHPIALVKNVEELLSST